MSVDARFNVLITGATSGIGRALALEYASDSSSLILLGRNQLSLESIGLLCANRGATLHLYTCDLSSSQAALRLSSEIAENHSVDLLILNAGLTNSTQGGKTEEWNAIESLLMVNLLGSLAISHHILEGMQQRKSGHVAYVSSLGAYYGMPLTPSYSASKAGLKAYAEAMRGLLTGSPISVTLITPGFVKTSLSDKFPGDKPFMISADKAAERIKRGLDRKKRVISFPLLLTMGMRILSILPAKLADAILVFLKY